MLIESLLTPSLTITVVSKKSIKSENLYSPKSLKNSCFLMLYLKNLDLVWLSKLLLLPILLFLKLKDPEVYTETTENLTNKLIFSLLSILKKMKKI